MNFLTFVFSLLILLSFGTFAILEKLSNGRRLRSSYLGHLVANRKMISRCEIEAYRGFRAIPKKNDKPKGMRETITTTTPQFPKINPECAFLNLCPLIQEGKEAHPLLYEIAAKMFKLFYGAALFENKPRFEYRFLDAFLKQIKEALQQKTLFSLEKLSFNDASLQMMYYKMLKGAQGKNRDLPNCPLDPKIELSAQNQIGYPSLLDAISIEESPSKVCLFHAHPNQLSIFFGPKAALKIFQKIHQSKPPLVTREWIEKICSESHVMFLDSKIFDLIAISRLQHKKKFKKTWIEEDETTHITLRKNIYLPKS